MAKTAVKKTKSAPKIEAQAPAAPIKTKTRDRKSVFVYLTASELRDRIGADVRIGISRKELTAIILKEKKAQLLADEGLE